ncbi:MAG: hypothetical protein WC714_28915 [Candidatus Obscuribacterales bacterium]|jgi:hypothetical protein
MDILEYLAVIAKEVETLPPEEKQKRILELKKILPTEFIAETRKDMLAILARQDNPDGYAAFYELMGGTPPPPHVMIWIRKIYKSANDGIGTVLFAFRGSWKTTSVSVKFVAHQIGLHPEKTNLIICSNGPSANKIMKAIADIIELHPEWKRTFPTIVPYPEKWSTEGYSVYDNSMPIGDWAKKQTSTIDPTLFGGGYDSHQLNGKHPSGILLFDDIHDDKNSRSEKERQGVISVLTSELLKTAIRIKDKLVTKIIDIGTPWADDDAHHVLKDSGEYAFEQMPAMTRANPMENPTDGTDVVYIDGVSRNGAIYEDIKGWWKLAWPDNYGIGSAIADRATMGKSDFWRQVMLDLTIANSAKIKYYLYARDEIKNDWPMIGGVDPTNTGVSSLSNFALAYVAKKPGGGVVIVDGVLEKCSALQAENHILYAQEKFPAWQYSACENVGGGAVFLQMIQRNPKIRAIASGLKGITDSKIRNKKDRFLSDAARWFEDGTITISDADTPFLNALRRGFDKIHDLDPATSPEFDAMDSVYHALRQMPDVLRMPLSDSEKLGAKVRKIQHSPMWGARNHVGYGA